MAVVENTYALTDLEAVGRQLGVKPSQDEEAYITDLINQVSAKMEGYAGRRFRNRTYTHDGTTLARLDSFGGTKLWLDNPPITSVTTLKLYPGTTALTAGYASGYLVKRDEGIIELVNGNVFFDLAQVVEITYAGGYHDGPSASESYYTGWFVAAADLALAAAQQVAHEYKRKARERDGLVSVSAGGATYTYKQEAWLPEVVEVLDRYTRRLPSWR